MKWCLLILIAVLAVPATQAAGLPRESLGGTVWGAVIGGLAGGDCRNAWSGKGAAIGAGIGFVAGTLAGESRRAAERQYYSQPASYTYVAQQPVASSPRPETPDPKPHPQIPNAPRVPDAPTF